MNGKMKSMKSSRMMGMSEKEKMPKKSDDWSW